MKECYYTFYSRIEITDTTKYNTICIIEICDAKKHVIQYAVQFSIYL